MPYEFTKEGMLQRLNAYIENQDFCASSPPHWPPPESVVTIAGDLGKSCKEMCRQRGMQKISPNSYRSHNVHSSYSTVLKAI